MLYVMSDIHGDFQNFYKMLVKINFSPLDTLYVLGDILDRNKESLCVYSFIRDEKNIVLLKGNHEYLCEGYIKGKISSYMWDTCGGSDTRREVDRLGEKERQRLYDYLRNLLIFFSTISMRRQKQGSLIKKLLWAIILRCSCPGIGQLRFIMGAAILILIREMEAEKKAGAFPACV